MEWKEARGTLIVALGWLALTLGTVFSIELQVVAYWLILIGAAMLIHFVAMVFKARVAKEELSSTTLGIGILGALVLALLIGQQSPQLYWQFPGLVTIIFALIGGYRLMKKNNKKEQIIAGLIALVTILVVALILAPDKPQHDINVIIEDRTEDYQAAREQIQAEQQAQDEQESLDEDPLFEYIELEDDIKVTEDGTKYLVHPNKIRAGGPPKDGIPSLDNPRYTDVETAMGWLPDNELVMAIDYKGVQRVYPLQILVWHEIVNDIIAEDPILITYCPLCGSGIAFRGEIDGERVEFGTSGKLFNSNLVMYDRKTDSYWTQVAGRAIIGELTGMQLEPVSIETVTFGEWRKAFPDSEVLTRQTGYTRSYGHDPYGSYYEDDYLIFPVDNEDRSIHPKTVIFGVELNGHFRAYKEDDVKDLVEFTDTISGVDVTVSRGNGGIVKIIRNDNGEELVKERDFWFAWYAFHPDTTVFEP